MGVVRIPGTARCWSNSAEGQGAKKRWATSQLYNCGRVFIQRLSCLCSSCRAFACRPPTCSTGAARQPPGPLVVPGMCAPGRGRRATIPFTPNLRRPRLRRRPTRPPSSLAAARSRRPRPPSTSRPPPCLRLGRRLLRASRSWRTWWRMVRKSERASGSSNDVRTHSQALLLRGGRGAVVRPCCGSMCVPLGRVHHHKHPTWLERTAAGRWSRPRHMLPCARAR